MSSLQVLKVLSRMSTILIGFVAALLHVNKRIVCRLIQMRFVQLSWSLAIVLQMMIHFYLRLLVALNVKCNCKCVYSNLLFLQKLSR